MSNTAERDALLAQVYDNPEDDLPRMVFADWLSSRGDPRGEFSLLQCARARSGNAHPGARERELWERYRYLWMGTLLDHVAHDSLVFRRGFLAECRVGVGWRDWQGWKRRKLLARPEWATVECLGSNDPDLLNQPHLLSLRSIGPVMIRRLGPLGQLAPVPRVTRLTVGLERDQRENAQHLADAPASALRTALPGLHRLCILYRDEYAASAARFTADDCRWILDHPLCQDVPVLEVRKHLTLPLDRWLGSRESRPELMSWLSWLREHPGTQAVALVPCHGWRLTVVRGDSQDRGPHLHVDWYTAHATADLQVLQLALAQVERGTFVQVTGTIHDLVRPHHQQFLELILERYGAFSWAGAPPL